MPPTAAHTQRVLEGVPEYDAASESFSDVRALQAALRFLGEDPGLSTLLAVTGEAFRMAVHAERWTVASAYVCPEPVLGVGARACGFQPRYLVGASFDETWLAMTDAVDAGMPALSSGIATQSGVPLKTWWFVIRGYDASEKAVQVTGLLTRSTEFAPLPSLHGRPLTWTGIVRGLGLAPGLWAGRPVFLLGRKGQAPEPQALARETVERAVRLSRESAVTVPPEVPAAAGRYVLGLSGFQAWAAKLSAITGQEAFFRRDPQEGKVSSVAVTADNRETADRVRQGRRAAAEYLRHASDLFAGAAHDALLSASMAYGEVADLAEEYLRLFAAPTALMEQDLLREHGNRRKGAAWIRQMQALEAAAVNQLAAALKR